MNGLLRSGCEKSGKHSKTIFEKFKCWMIFCRLLNLCRFQVRSTMGETISENLEINLHVPRKDLTSFTIRRTWHFGNGFLFLRIWWNGLLTDYVSEILCFLSDKVAFGGLQPNLMFFQSIEDQLTSASSGAVCEHQYVSYVRKLVQYYHALQYCAHECDKPRICPRVRQKIDGASLR